MGGHYERGLFRQVEELTQENERLKKENRELRRENRRLREENARLTQRVTTLEATMEERIQKAVDEAVAKATAPLLETIAQQEREIHRLKAQLGKDSSNSSKPSSTDGFQKVPNNREKSEKKQGGQRGHKGHTLRIPKNLDELVKQGRAEHIINSDVPEGEPYVSDWRVDFKVIPVYTEHRRAPGQTPKIEYGPQVKTLAVYLSTVGQVPYQRLSQTFCDLFQGLIPVSKATLEKFNHEAAQAVPVEAYIQDLLNGEVLHVDETPIRTSEKPGADEAMETAKNTSFQAYERVYCNETTTVMKAAARKTQESVDEDDILPRFCGTLCHDHEAKFYNYGDQHATCGAHLCRELKGLEELQMIPWAGAMRRFLLEMNTHKNEDVHGGKPSCEPALLCQYEARYDELVAEGSTQLEFMEEGSFGYKELRCMVKRLTDYKDSYLRFMRDYTVPFTNNEAERDLRPCKIKQKVSGPFRSWSGLLDSCNLRSLLATAKKRGQNLFNAIASLCSPSPAPAGQ